MQEPKGYRELVAHWGRQARRNARRLELVSLRGPHPRLEKLARIAVKPILLIVDILRVWVRLAVSAKFQVLLLSLYGLHEFLGYRSAELYVYLVIAWMIAQGFTDFSKEVRRPK